MNEIDEKKTKYFVIAIVLLILLSVILIVHFNNKELVSGNEENKTTTTSTTTTMVTTTKKKKTTIKNDKPVKEEIKEELVVYKSTIDENNKLIYNYKLTEEIKETDKIISTRIDINENLKKENVILLYDISLYDENLEKKVVLNSSIDISIPVIEELKEYEELKVVYIDEENNITNEEYKITVENGYVKFTTTHLSKFGIVGIKKKVEEVVVDLSKVTVDVKVNDEIVENITNILLKKEDKIDLVINNIEENIEYETYYGLKVTGKEDLNYEKYDGVLNLEEGLNYKLFVKVSSKENEKTFEIGNIGLYDEVFKYDKNEEVKENVVIGKIESETDIPYDYKDIEKNTDIVIDSIDKVETNEENTPNKEETNTNNNISSDLGETDEESNINNETDTNIKNDNDSNILDETKEETDTNKDVSTELEVSENNATISLNGNIYLVEKTDISELHLTGYLFIDTAEDIVFAQNKEEKMLLDNLYNVTIRSKEFTLNGIKYSYEYTENGLVIYVIKNQTETEEEIKEEIEETEFNELFADNYGVVADENKNNLIIGIIEENTISSETTNENFSGETKIDVETILDENITE